MDVVPQVVLIVAWIVIPFLFLLNGWSCLATLRRGESLLPYRHRDTVSWGLLDMGLYVIVFAAIVGLGVKLTSDRLGISDTTQLETLAPRKQAAVMFAYGASSMLAILLCLGWNLSRFNRLEGFELNSVVEDMQLGFHWFTLLIVPVLLLQFILNQWFPTHHPLIEMLQKSGDRTLLPIAAFVAVISAPVFEETFFRLFLQGWLEKLRITRLRTQLGLTTKADRDAVLLGGSTAAPLEPDSRAPVRPSAATLPNAFDVATPDHPGNVLSAYKTFSVPDKSELDSTTTPGSYPILWNPILFSSTMFALAHWSHGPDWIPLFFLSIGMGYLYQRTGRILPSMVVHFLVNALGIVQLWASIELGS